jgi:hypothetical protein
MTLTEALVLRLRGVGLTAYALNSPDEQNATVTVTPYLGEPLTADQGVVGDVQGVQFFTRGPDFPSAEELAWQAYEEISRVLEEAEVTLGYVSLAPNQAPSYLGQDEKGRHLFSFNARYRRVGV